MCEDEGEGEDEGEDEGDEGGEGDPVTEKRKRKTVSFSN